MDQPRLFVATELPEDTITALRALQPVAAGVRRIDTAQMHLTLHFLGPSDLPAVTAALATVRHPRLRLALRGVGQFPTQGGTVTLWANLVPNEGLQSLHGAVGRALATVGFVPETRPFLPHITLARCNAGVPASVVDGFLADHAGFAVDDVPTTEFVLFSSTFVNGTPVYRREARFPLA